MLSSGQEKSVKTSVSDLFYKCSGGGETLDLTKHQQKGPEQGTFHLDNIYQSYQSQLNLHIPEKYH